MNDWDCRKNPVYITRDAGYSKLGSISPENRKKTGKSDDYDIVARSDLLKELYEKIGVVIHPERMTNWYAFTD